MGVMVILQNGLEPGKNLMCIISTVYHWVGPDVSMLVRMSSEDVHIV